MVEADADVEDALVEEADQLWLGAPHVFQRLVLIEELARIELVNRLEQQLRRRLVTVAARLAASQSFQRRLDFDVLERASLASFSHAGILAGLGSARPGR